MRALLDESSSLSLQVTENADLLSAADFVDSWTSRAALASQNNAEIDALKALTREAALISCLQQTSEYEVVSHKIAQAGVLAQRITGLLRPKKWKESHQKVSFGDLVKSQRDLIDLGVTCYEGTLLERAILDVTEWSAKVDEALARAPG